MSVISQLTTMKYSLAVHRLTYVVERVRKQVCNVYSNIYKSTRGGHGHSLFVDCNSCYARKRYTQQITI